MNNPALISTDNHHRFLVKRFDENNGHFLSSLSPQSQHLCEDLQLSFLEYDKTYDGSSCNGLLYFDNLKDHGFLYNPTTKDFKSLPPCTVEHTFGTTSTYYTCSGFGYDSESQDYKVIRFMMNCKEEELENIGSMNNLDTTYKMELYSLKNDCWRELSGYDIYVCDIRRGAYVNGSYYWGASRGYSLVIYSFDFSNESISSFPYPAYNGAQTVSVFLEFDGLLGVIYYSSRGIARFCKLWVLNQAGLWTKVFNITLYGVRTPLGFSKSGRLLYFEEMDNRRGQLLVYDRTTQELNKLDIYQLPLELKKIGGRAQYRIENMELYSYSFVETTIPLLKPNTIIW